MYLIPLKLSQPLLIRPNRLPIALHLLAPPLLRRVLEHVEHPFDRPTDRPFHEIHRIRLIFDIVKNFEAETSPVFITFKRLLK